MTHGPCTKCPDDTRVAVPGSCAGLGTRTRGVDGAGKEAQVIHPKGIRRAVLLWYRLCMGFRMRVKEGRKSLEQE